MPPTAGSLPGRYRCQGWAPPLPDQLVPPKTMHQRTIPVGSGGCSGSATWSQYLKLDLYIRAAFRWRSGLSIMAIGAPSLPIRAEGPFSATLFILHLPPTCIPYETPLYLCRAIWLPAGATIRAQSYYLPAGPIGGIGNTNYGIGRNIGRMVDLQRNGCLGPHPLSGSSWSGGP